MYKLLDIIHDNKNQDKFINYINYICETDEHVNIKNYKMLSNIKYLTDYYFRFTMLTNDDDIIAIQGIRHSSHNMVYPSNIVRICDRHYVDTKYRSNNFGKREPYYAKYCLKSDIEYLKDNNPEVDTVFVSMEGTKGHKFFERRQLELYRNEGYEFKLDDRFYQTCTNTISKQCWQTSIYCNIKDEQAVLNLPYINYEQWSNKL